jgi:Sec-independent protein translocase protein TatA
VSDILVLLIIALVVVLFIRGPKMLPRLGEALGRGIKDTRAELDRKSTEDDSSGVPPVPPA